MIHFVDDLSNPKVPKKKARRTISVRYGIHDEDYEEDEDGSYDYDMDEIAKTSIPYLKSLLDLNNKLIKEFKTGGN